MEELKILQTLMVLGNCLDFVHGELLATVPVSDILILVLFSQEVWLFRLSGVCSLLSIALRTRLCY